MAKRLEVSSIEPLTNSDTITAVQIAARDRQLSSIKRILLAILIILMIISAYFAKDAILPIVLGFLLALTLSPMVRGLARAGIAPPITAISLIVVTGLAIGSGAYAISGPVTEWIDEAPQLGQKLRMKLYSLNNSMDAVKEASKQVEQITAQGSDPQVAKVVIEKPGLLNSAVTNAASIGTTIMVMLILALFLLSSGDMFYHKLVEAFPKFGDKKKALKIVYGIERSVSRYLLTITLINAGLGIAIATGLTLVGMPQAIVWGTIAFLLNFLPFVGALIGTALIAAVSIITFDSLTYALLAPAVYLACTALEGQIVTPTILGHRLEMNTVSVFITVVFWGWLWGIAGALMAVPFLVCVKVICDNVDQLKVIGHFLGSDGRTQIDPLRTEHD